MNSGCPAPSLPRPAFLDLFNDRGVETDATMEQEIATFHRTEPDAFHRTAAESVNDYFGGLERVVGETEDASEHICGATRQRSQRGGAARQPVRRLVESAVASQNRHDVVTIARR